MMVRGKIMSFVRPELVEEFMAQPFGFHSPDLQYLLNAMREPSHEPFPVLFAEIPGARWRLAYITPGDQGSPMLTELSFSSPEDAERHVFAERWDRLVSGPRLDR